MLGQTARAAAAAAVASNMAPLLAAPAPFDAVRQATWDMHGHLNGVSGTPEQRITQLLKYADRLGIERLIVCMGTVWATDPSPEELRSQNDDVLRAVAHAPDRVLGLVYVSPKHVDASLKEMDRCVRDGPMVGVKLWVAARCHDKQIDPIIRRAHELKAPIFQHTWFKTTGNMPGESSPSDLAELARRHPDVPMVAIHTGGMWELGIRAICPVPNISAGLSGSGPMAGMVEMAVRELGAERVMYGSDYGGRSFASQLGKVYSADIPEAARRLILRENVRRVLQPILKAKGIKS